MLAPFEIHEPKTVAEASALLTHYGDGAAVYAGGTELLVVMKERINHFPHLINIKTIPGLDRIHLAGDELVIGALATHRTIANSALVEAAFPALAELERRIANVRVRTAGTIGGNLCFAEPHSDPATLLLALGARFTLESKSGTRTLEAEAFFAGNRPSTQRNHDRDQDSAPAGGRSGRLRALQNARAAERDRRRRSATKWGRPNRGGQRRREAGSVAGRRNLPDRDDIER